MIKKEFWLIKDKEAHLITILGFNGKDGYGEIHLRDKRSTTYVFRGYDRQKVMKKAKNELKSKNY
ncbi:hypothetical protein [Rossellomorea aquimaris]|uniref:hypothetical protein n=1 Tax=Rossellomorea aquimaris TaxID=189382 RepID=UPI0007D0B549|nr:hypothetical protein [Rossellomorea aquimaris]